MWLLNCYTGLKEKCIGSSKNSLVDSLEKFRRSVVDKGKSDICILQKGCDSKENNTKIQYANDFFQKLGMGDLIKYVYQFIYNEKDKMTHR